MLCGNCGKELSEGIKFCDNCGQLVNLQQQPVELPKQGAPIIPLSGEDISTFVSSQNAENKSKDKKFILIDFIRKNGKYIGITLAVVIAIFVLFKVISGIKKSSSVLSKEKYDMVCKYTDISNNGKAVIIQEMQYAFKDLGDYITSYITIKVYKKDHSKLTNENVEKIKAIYENNQYANLSVELTDDNEAIIVKYGQSLLKYPDVSDIKSDFVKLGYKCS